MKRNRMPLHTLGPQSPPQRQTPLVPAPAPAQYATPNTPPHPSAHAVASPIAAHTSYPAPRERRLERHARLCPRGHPDPPQSNAVPANAEDPNRLRPNRAPFFIRPIDDPHRRRRFARRTASLTARNTSSPDSTAQRTHPTSHRSALSQDAFTRMTAKLYPPPRATSPTNFPRRHSAVPVCRQTPAHAAIASTLPSIPRPCRVTRHRGPGHPLRTRRVVGQPSQCRVGSFNSSSVRCGFTRHTQNPRGKKCLVGPPGLEPGTNGL